MQQPVQPPQGGSAPSRLSTLQLILILLLIVFLGSLGSFSWSSNLFPAQSSTQHPVGASFSSPSKATPVPTNVHPTPTPIVGPFTESECTATSKTIKYLPLIQGQTNSVSLSGAWSQAGRNQQDFANAQACAAAFVTTYETFSATNLKMLQNCTSMLTDGAKMRFTGTAPNTRPDQHMDPMWQASLQKQAYQQTARAAAPGLLNASYTDERLLVWMIVPYQTSLQIDKGLPVAQNAQMTVLLVGVPINTDKTGTGWQISQWKDGNTQFDPPAPL
jgi:hypothetical protein